MKAGEPVTDFKVLTRIKDPLTGKQTVTAEINGRVFLIDVQDQERVRKAFLEGRLVVDQEGNKILEEQKDTQERRIP